MAKVATNRALIRRAGPGDYQFSRDARRLAMIGHQFGETDHHLERLVAGLQAG